MDNDVVKKANNSSNLAKNKSSSKKTTNSSKKKSTKNSNANKKSTPEKKLSSNTKKTAIVKNESEKHTDVVEDVKQTVKKSNASTKKKKTPKKSNTYQYNKRNLENNKKSKIQEKKVIQEEILDFDKTIKIERVVEKKDIEPIEIVLNDINLNKNDNNEIEILDYTGYIKIKDKKDKSKEEVLEDTLTESEKLSIREEEILEDILEDKKALAKKDKIDDFYPFDEEDIELLDEDTMYKTLRLDLYNVYDRDNDFKENKYSTKTVENIEDKLLLVDNILTDETREKIVSENIIEKEDNDDEEYYNIILWDSIIGFLFVIFTTLAIFAIWFVVYLTTY